MSNKIECDVCYNYATHVSFVSCYVAEQDEPVLKPVYSCEKCLDIFPKDGWTKMNDGVTNNHGN